MHNPTDRIVHTTTFVTPVVEHFLGEKIAQWVHREVSDERTTTARLSVFISLEYIKQKPHIYSTK